MGENLQCTESLRWTKSLQCAEKPRSRSQFGCGLDPIVLLLVGLALIYEFSCGLICGFGCGLICGFGCGLDLCCKRWLGLIYVICILFVCIVQSRIGKAVEERNCRRKKVGEEGRREKKNLTERREKK